jgi:cysteine-rich repeat protein
LCGNGTPEGQEACDDGNDIDNDVCANDCTLNPSCGNGQIDPGEACDENAQETSTCTALCALPFFNNGRIDPGLGEACDDGNNNPNDFCHDGVIGNVTSCADIQQVAPSTGAYVIDIDGAGPLAPVTVHCNMDVDGGGWTRVLLTNIDLAIAQLPEGNTSDAGRLSTVHVAALARRSQQVHIRTLDDEARSVTSVLEALPVDRLRLGASLAPVQRGYPLVQVNADWSGPFVARLAASAAPTHTAWPDVYEAAGNAQGLQLFDNGTQLVSRWGGNTNEAHRSVASPTSCVRRRRVAGA